MPDNPSERRSKARVAARVPVTIKSENGDSSAQTRDLSSNGVFLYTESKFSEGSELEMVLVLPPELTQGEKRWACCQASVVRVEAGDGAKFGIAATIRRMELMPEIPS